MFEAERVQGLAGFYFLDANAFNEFDVVLGQLGIASFTEGDVDTETWAVFTDLNIDLSDTLSLSVGARFTSDKRDSVVVRDTFLGLASPAFGAEDAVSLIPAPLLDENGNEVVPRFEGSRTDEDFTPRISISWYPNEDIHLYASISQGFKGGGFDPRGDYSNPEVREGFKPENVDAYEMGVKSTYLGGRLNTNLALFFSDYTDVQIPGSIAIDTDNDGVDDSFAGTVTNAGEAEIKGLELEMTAQITDDFRSALALGIIDAEYQEYIVNGEDVSDERVFQNTPDTTASLSFTYEKPWEVFNSSGLLSFITSANYRSETNQFEVENEFLDQEGYTLLNASVVWTSDDNHWQVGLHGLNLTDKEYKVAGYNFPTLGEGVITAFYGNPRTVTGSVKYNFL